MPICDICKAKIDEPEPEPVPEPEPEPEPTPEPEPVTEQPRRRGRPSHVVDKVAQKKIYNHRYYVRAKERKAIIKKVDINDEN